VCLLAMSHMLLVKWDVKPLLTVAASACVCVFASNVTYAVGILSY